MSGERGLGKTSLRWDLSRDLKDRGNLLFNDMVQSVSGRRKSKCKGPGVELFCLRKSKEAVDLEGSLPLGWRWGIKERSPDDSRVWDLSD